MRATLAALAVVALSVAPPAPAQELSPRISVTGTAEAQVPPDVATFNAGVVSEAADARTAFEATGAAMQAVFGALGTAGIAPEDMQTSELAIEPLWSDGSEGEPRVRGYSATNMVRVQVRDLARLGAAIDAAGVAGANRIFGIAFAVSAPLERQNEARRLAVADARAKAEVLATAAGVTLGPVLSIQEGGGGGPQPLFARAEMAGDAPIAEGTVSLGAQVEIVYAIE